MSLHDTLFGFSEWLDTQHLIASDQGEDADKRTHDDLAKDFLAAYPHLTESDNMPIIDIVKEAATALVNERDPGSVMTTAVLVYETSELHEDQVMYEVNYSVVTDSSLASAVGVLKVGSKLLLESAIDYKDDE